MVQQKLFSRIINTVPWLHLIHDYLQSEVSSISKADLNCCKLLCFKPALLVYPLLPFLNLQKNSFFLIFFLHLYQDLVSMSASIILPHWLHHTDHVFLHLEHHKSDLVIPLTFFLMFWYRVSNLLSISGDSSHSISTARSFSWPWVSQEQNSSSRHTKKTE